MAALFLVVEDNVLVAQALATTALGAGRVHVATTVGDGMASLSARLDWAGLLVDARMPDGNGLDVLAEAREMGCEAPALVLTALHDPVTINRAFELRARYLVKPADPLAILSFFREAAGASSAPESGIGWAERYALTQTEMAVLKAAAEGLARDQLAFERGIATTTLKKHVHNLLRKTGDASLLAAAARFLRDGGR